MAGFGAVIGQAQAPLLGAAVGGPAQPQPVLAPVLAPCGHTGGGHWPDVEPVAPVAVQWQTTGGGGQGPPDAPLVPDCEQHAQIAPLGDVVAGCGHGGLQDAVPVAPVAPAVPDCQQHAQIAPLGDVVAGCGHGGLQDSVPVAPVAPALWLMYAQTQESTPSGWPPPVVPVAPVEPVAGQGGWQNARAGPNSRSLAFNGRGHGKQANHAARWPLRIAPAPRPGHQRRWQRWIGNEDQPVEPLAPVEPHGGQRSQSRDPVHEVEPVDPVAPAGGHPQRKKMLGTGRPAVEPVAPVEPSAGHGRQRIAGSRSGAVADALDPAAAIGGHGSQRNAAPAQCLAPVAPVAAPSGHGQKERTIRRPRRPAILRPPKSRIDRRGFEVAAMPTHGLQAEPVEPVAPPALVQRQPKARCRACRTAARSAWVTMRWPFAVACGQTMNAP